jgi:hypothetical protein
MSEYLPSVARRHGLERNLSEYAVNCPIPVIFLSCSAMWCRGSSEAATLVRVSRKNVVHRPGNLPADARLFVGRLGELDCLEDELGPGGDGRLLTLLGVGGVGKTRLALRAAERASKAYADGVWLVELSALRSPGQVPLAVMEALRLADQSTGPVTDALCAWAQDKQLLLVLDSCEHLLADCADLVADLLIAAPGAACPRHQPRTARAGGGTGPRGRPAARRRP